LKRTLRTASGRSFSTASAISGHQAVAELLIAKGADVNATDANDKKPLDIARDNGRDAVAGVLERAMASAP
tara:strand:- start:102 stop:314 length:213 start_codon:yes stop_codon:yes gene_type:complete